MIWNSASKQIKEYVRSLNTPDNKIYQDNELLILSCFSKALEIIEECEKKSIDEIEVYKFNEFKKI